MRHMLVQQKEKGEPGSSEECGHHSGTPYCEIRDQPIRDPYYTYCANHPKRRSVRDPIPIGPILVAEAASGFAHKRVPLKFSPDTEEIRQHLIDLLNKPKETDAGDTYPAYPRVIDTIIWQLGQFRERGAVGPLQKMEKDLDGQHADFVRETLERIVGGTGAQD